MRAIRRAWVAFFFCPMGTKETLMSFTETLKHVLATAFLAGSAAVFTVLAQRSAMETVECLRQPGTAGA